MVHSMIQKLIIFLLVCLFPALCIAQPIYGPLQAQNNFSEIKINGTNSTAEVNLFGFTLTLSGNFATSGANSLTFTTTGSTNVTLPTSGTLLTSASAVTSFNTRTGAVTLTSGDVTTALGYTPVNAASAAITGGTINGTSVGATTPSTGSFTTLAASGTVSGSGFSTYLASPPAIGGSAANTGSFTNLSSSGTVSGTGFSNYLLSPPAIGTTSPAAGKFTTLQATGTVTGIGLIGMQVFTASGTYTADAGTQAIVVEIVAQGGGGGGCVASSSTQNCMSNGGSSGSYARVYYTSSFTPETVTIGTSGAGAPAGGNNGTSGSAASFGGLISCPGGIGGVAGAAFTGTVVTVVAGFTPPSACTISGGTTLASIVGQLSGVGMSTAEGVNLGQGGGSSPLGAGGAMTFKQGTGAAGTGFGAGGAGGASSNGAATGGGNPSGGEIIVFEFN